MDDFDRLRLVFAHRIARCAVALSPALLHGCGRPSASGNVEAVRAAAPAEASAGSRRATPGKAPPSQATRAPTPEERYDRTAPIPGDPPWVDGYNPEEEPCPSDNWCAPRAAVEPLAVGNEPSRMGCPARLAGTSFRNVENPEDPVYRGISHDGAMMAAFNENRTRLWREREKKDDICCYHWFEYCSGRPMMDDAGRPRLPRAEATGRARVTADRRAAALAYVEDARAEWAAVWAFRRAVEELLPFDPPLRLRRALRRAAADEVRHTRACLAAAAHLGLSARIDPQPLTLPPRRLDARGLARATFLEGAVAEGVAALVADGAASACADPVLAAILRRIAADEAEHAALAWAVLHCLGRGRPEVAEAVHAALSDVQAAARGPLAEVRPPRHEPAPPHLPALGRLGPAAHRTALAAVAFDLAPAMLADAELA
ncbi:MAG: ferritin-like domain-containing protein [Deltaproteobacteria bacterium]|nr:MAG: ferritin-like domain-containing protein [Deltaproteobacteria bacterium]